MSIPSNDAFEKVLKAAKDGLEEHWGYVIQSIHETEGCRPAGLALKIDYKPPGKDEHDGTVELVVAPKPATPKRVFTASMEGGQLSLGFPCTE